MTNNSEQLSLINEQPKADETSVVCLGMTFENEEARRGYFREELRKKLPELKQIEGFPIGEDEDIIALSDPPYFTACPNPWIDSFVKGWSKEESKYVDEPYFGDISEGKREPIYNVHTYHTKVPPKAIMRYLLHYTDPGDIVLDGFCGTGMTGIAASYCGIESKIHELGFSIDKNGLIKDGAEVKGLFGDRKAILGDLSPQATFIADTTNSILEHSIFDDDVRSVLKHLEDEYSWLYKTKKNDKLYNVNFYVWSDVFGCPDCQSELVFYDVASDETGKVKKEFECPNCGVTLNKRKVERLFEKKYDSRTKEYTNLAKQELIFVNYNGENGKELSRVDTYDIELLKKIEQFDIPDWYPEDKFPVGYNTKQPMVSHGITHVSQMFFKRELIVLSAFHRIIQEYNSSKYLNLLFTSQIKNLSKLNRYRPEVSFPYNPLNGTLYIGSLVNESNILDAYRNKAKRFNQAFIINNRNTIVSCSSSTKLELLNNSVDYIFTDPPFGANIMYSELSFMWESWQKVKTNNTEEAIMNSAQNKEYEDYLYLLIQVFTEYYRVLKPGKWITVEFSNSKARVWNSIQEAIQKAGFIIANVAALDKKQGSFKAVTSTTAVKQDLVISAYKPREIYIEKMKSESATEESAWTFVSQHLEKLPIFQGSKGETIIIAERTPRILFDRMIAYHVQSGLPVPISSAEFQQKVSQKYATRDGMIFLESQVAEYDKKRILAKVFSQQTLFVSDENSAIEWIRQQLMKKPQTRQDLHPQFMKEIQHIAKHEELPELDDLLVQNFLRYEGDTAVSDQIAGYLRRNYHEYRGLDNDNDKLKAKAINYWYVPDPNKQADLEKLREKTLLREFESYIEELEKHKKKLSHFRTEAIRAGFKKAWTEKDYKKIVSIGDRLPETVIQEDDKLLMYYDNAQIRIDM